MTRPLAAVVLLVALAIGAVLYAVARDDGASGVVPEPPSPRAAASEAPAVELSDARSPAPERARAEPPAETPATAKPRVDLAIRGRVVSGDGRAQRDVDVALARVSVGAADARTDLGTQESPYARTRSGSDGTFAFELADPPEGEIVAFGLLCRRSGLMARATKHDVPAGARVVELGDVVLQYGTTLHGSVRDLDGAPVENARVQARSDSGSQSALSRADGTFTVEDGPSGRVELSARLEDRRRTADDVAVDVIPGGVLGGIALVVPSYADPDAILGVVQDVDGSALAGASVAATYRTSAGGGGIAARKTDERGRFRIEAIRGAAYAVTATHPREPSTSVTVDDVVAGRHDLVLRLAPPRLATLRVRDARGAPIARFGFVTRVVGKGGVNRYTERRKPEDRPGGECPLPIPESSFFVAVDAPGFASAEIGPFDPGARVDVVDAMLRAIPALRGRVVRGSEPIAGAKVHALRAVENDRRLRDSGFDLLARAWDAMPGAVTADDGTFLLDTQGDGDWFLRAEDGGDASALIGPRAVVADGITSEIVLDLGPRGAIEGVVSSTHGDALAGRVVGASCGDGVIARRTTDERGRYSFDRLAPGAWQVHVIAADMAGDRVESYHTGAPRPIAWDCYVAAGATSRRDLVLPDAARLEVRVVEAEPRLATGKWSVRARRADAPNESAASVRGVEASGVHALELPAAGLWRVTVEYAAGPTRLQLTRTHEVPPGTSALSFGLSRGSIRGRVRGPVATTSVALGGDADDGTRVFATVDAVDGTFEFPFTLTGAFELEVDDGASGRRAPVRVTSGATVDAGEI